MVRADPAVGGMKQLIDVLRAVALGTAAIFGAMITDDAIGEPIEDVDYVVIAPHASLVPEKIEVIEFFYYGCDSCNRLEPRLQSWLKTLAPDISFRRVPALRRASWAPLTKVYYALEQLGELDRLHARVYRAVHDEGLNLGNSSELYAWATKVSLDRAKLEQVLDSDLLQAQVQRAHDMTVAYGIRATPSFVVDGEYMTSSSLVGTLEALLPTVDALVGKARLSRSSK